MSADLLLCVCMTLTAMTLAFLTRRTTGSFLHPISFYNLVWSGFLTVHLCFAPDIRPCATGSLWIVTSCILFTLGSVATRQLARLAGNAPSPDRRETGSPVTAAPARFATVLYVTSAIGFLYSIGSLLTGGFGLSMFTSSSEYSRTTSDISADRYSANPTQAVFWVQLTLLGVYAAPILGGVSSAHGTTRWARTKSLITLLPALIVCLTQTTRAPIMFALLLWAAGYFSQKVFVGGPRTRMFTTKEWVILGATGFAAVFLYAVGDVLRQGEIPSAENLADVLISPRIRGSLFGSLNAFSTWLQEGSGSQLLSPKFGALTFGGVFEMLGFRLREVGLYGDDAIEVLPGIYTNIFTVHRGLIQDFTLPGAMTLFLIFGGLASAAYERVAQGEGRLVGCLLIFYAFTSSCLTSIATYNSMLLALVLAAAYTLIFGKKASFSRPPEAVPPAGP